MQPWKTRSPGRSREDQGGFEDFGTALWWTAMILATMGSAYWPQTADGRLLCLILTVCGVLDFRLHHGHHRHLFITADARQKPGLNRPEATGG